MSIPINKPQMNTFFGGFRLGGKSRKSRGFPTPYFINDWLEK
jgi:hypothetical protein